MVQLWREREPKRAYEVIVVGAGGHGLATAYHLARDHGITDVAVLERGWLAGGNMARNTTIIRSNYLEDASAAIYEHALKLWEGLADDLSYDIAFRQMGVVNLAHDLHDVREGVRRVNANRVNGVDAQWLTPEEVKKLAPVLDVSGSARYPVHGGTFQPRAGTADHDLVAWGYARAADRLGVHLIQDCQVTGFVRSGTAVTGVETTRGRIMASRVGLCAAGHTSVLAAELGVRLPLQSHPLQALVSELFEPVLDVVVMSNKVHVYAGQAPKGELVLGAGIDSYNGYGRRGSFRTITDQLAAAVALFPVFGRAHVLRTWAGIVDVTPDASPIIGPLGPDNVFVNCGWGTGGFKATPGVGDVFAATLAHGRPHPLAGPYGLERFTSGALIDEHGAAAVAH